MVDEKAPSCEEHRFAGELKIPIQFHEGKAEGPGGRVEKVVFVCFISSAIARHVLCHIYGVLLFPIWPHTG